MLVHASTVLATTSKAIHAHIQQHLIKASFHEHQLLYTIFPSLAHAPDLPLLVNSISQVSKSSLGSVSASLPGYEDYIGCSIAVFDKNHVVPFRSTIPGKAPTQVGRWHSFRQKDAASAMSLGDLPDGPINWEDVWATSVKSSDLPRELEHIKPSDVHSLLYFSDSAYQGLTNSLQAFPTLKKLGLIASSTPFLTGHPFTLFHNGKTHASGAVGLAFTGPTPKMDLSFEATGLNSITEPLLVTQSEGNMVLSLNNSNPTQLLLNAIRKNGMDMDATGSFKEDEQFFLATLSDSTTIETVHHITSGDPSRGSIALDADVAPSRSSLVQFLHRPKTSKVHIPNHSSQLGFIVSNQLSSIPQDVVLTDYSDATVLENTFLAASENGFIIPNSAIINNSWRCTVPGATTRFEW